jgi:type II secretion system protein G
MIRKNVLLSLATLLATAATWGCANSSSETQSGDEATQPRADGELLPKAKIAQAKADIAIIDQGLVTFFVMNGKYPLSLEYLTAKDANGYRILDGAGLPQDPWQNEYVYQPPVGEQERNITSLGADGQPGGEGDDADITLADLEDQ